MMTPLLANLEKISAALAAAVNHRDPMVDQLLAIKQTAWLLRYTKGDIAIMLSNALTSGKLSPEQQKAYASSPAGPKQRGLRWSCRHQHAVVAGTDGGVYRRQGVLFRPAVSGAQRPARRCADQRRKAGDAGRHV